MKPKITLTTLLVLLSLATVLSQTSTSPSTGAESDAALKQQLADLQAKVKQLDAALAPQSHATSGASRDGGRVSASGGMNMGAGMSEMNPAGMQAGRGMGMMNMMGDMSMMDQMMSSSQQAPA